MHALLALVATNPALFVGAVAVAVFFVILATRKFFPRAWHALEGRLVCLNGIDSDALFSFTWKAVQTIPGMLVGVLMTALASGGDPITMLLGALAGPVASIGHEVLKRYSGYVPIVPKAPKLPTLLLLLGLGFAPALNGCMPDKPAVSLASVPNDVAIAYRAAGSALAVADVINAAYMDALVSPSQADVDRAVTITSKLVAIKRTLDACKADLAHAREQLREVVGPLRDVLTLMQVAGVKVPGVALDALNEVEKVLK